MISLSTGQSLVSRRKRLIIVAALGMIFHPGLLATAGTNATGRAQFKAELNKMEMSLNEIQELAGKLETASADMLDELGRDPETASAPPGTLDSPLAAGQAKPVAFNEKGNFAPARKRFLKYYSFQMEQALSLLSNDIKDTIVPEIGQNDLSDRWNQLKSLVNKAETEFPMLQNACKDDPINRLAMGKLSIQIHKDAGTIKNYAGSLSFYVAGKE